MKRITIKKTKTHPPYSHTPPKNQKERQENLKLLFELQKLAYPELMTAIRMKKNVVRWKKR